MWEDTLRRRAHAVVLAALGVLLLFARVASSHCSQPTYELVADESDCAGLPCVLYTSPDASNSLFYLYGETADGDYFSISVVPR